jgi:homogentisate 1,2-dioxygenase
MKSKKKKKTRLKKFLAKLRLAGAKKKILFKMSASSSSSSSSFNSEKDEKYTYMCGWNNQFATEAREGALPVGQNTPQKLKYDLYAEQISGTAFTVARSSNRRTWLYRVKPSVSHSKYSQVPNVDGQFSRVFERATPEQLRWKPFEIDVERAHTFVQGLQALCGAGDPMMKSGICTYVYTATESMVDSSFYSADGEMLIVPQQGSLDIQTECGHLLVRSGEICVVPRGINFSVGVDGPSRGYMLEVYNQHFVIPDLGPIGANGLANPRDFLYPIAAYEERACDFTVYAKFMGELHSTKRDHSVFNVVAWHGNYAPYKYDLDRFCAVNSVTFDHMDPSIFTVLTCPSASPGTAVADFVIFPGRWAVQEHTFRPPYFHRNCMSEFMGLIRGEYEAKKGGFLPGGASLHSCMSAHGPDKRTFDIESELELKPQRYPNTTLAFMFESSYIFNMSDFALEESRLDQHYHEAWQGF